jgi:lysozyme
MLPVRRRTKRFIFLLTVLFFAAAGFSLWQEWRMHRPAAPRRWQGFDLALPEGYAIHGIDVSHYQGRIDWTSVKAMKDKDVSLRFAFIKATEGINSTDNAFDDNWRQCSACSLTRGAYHFFHPGLDPWLQALRFILSVQLAKGDLPPVLDAEVTEGLPPDIIRERLCTWLNMVETWYHVKPVIYTNVGFYRDNLKGYFNEYPLWIAHYGVTYPQVDEPWAFWQHSERGHVNGIDAWVDFNTFSGDSAAFNVKADQIAAI